MKNIAEHEARLAELDAALARIAVLEHKLMEAEHPTGGTYTLHYGKYDEVHDYVAEDWSE